MWARPNRTAEPDRSNQVVKHQSLTRRSNTRRANQTVKHWTVKHKIMMVKHQTVKHRDGLTAQAARSDFGGPARAEPGRRARNRAGAPGAQFA